MNLGAITAAIDYSSVLSLAETYVEALFGNKTKVITTLGVVGIGLAIAWTYRSYAQALAAAQDLVNNRALIAAQSIQRPHAYIIDQYENVKALLGQTPAQIKAYFETVKESMIDYDEFVRNNNKSLKILCSVPLFLARLAIWKTGVDVNAKGNSTEKGYRLLHGAVRFREHEVMRLLKGLGADFKALDSSEQTLFSLAFEYWDENDRTGPALFKLLKELGADVDAQDGLKKETPLYRAVYNHCRVIPRLALVRLLLTELHANPNVPNKDGETPIFSAAASYNNAVVQLLVDSGANVNARDSEGRTVLDLIERDFSNDLSNTMKALLIRLGAKTGKQLDGK